MKNFIFRRFRAVKILDQIAPYETHRVGVLYIREGQVNSEVEILKNSFGSLRYVKFLQNLGSLVKISDVDPQVLCKNFSCMIFLFIT